jgi:hypothetical protein
VRLAPFPALWFGAALAIAAQGCLAPTLPIPPPSEPTVTFNESQQTVTLSGGKGSASPNAMVLVTNESGQSRCKSGCNNTGYKLAIEDGSWDPITVAAQRNDVVTVQQFTNGESSTVREIIVGR